MSAEYCGSCGSWVVSYVDACCVGVDSVVGGKGGGGWSGGLRESGGYSVVGCDVGEGVGSD